MNTDYLNLIIQYSTNLKKLSQHNFIGKFLEPSSVSILKESAQTLFFTVQNVKRGKTTEWEFIIEKENPLELIMSNHLNLHICISCKIKGNRTHQTTHNSVIEIWTSNKEMYLRKELDTPELEKKIEESGGKRLMMRIHFDQRESDCNKSEPFHHMHIGGVHKGRGFCWLHQKLDVPRIPNPPLDLILAIELIFLDLFPDKFEELRYQKKWRMVIKTSQELFLRDYFCHCIKSLDSQNETLLSTFVNKNK